ncbi:MAG: hypothetical protein RIR43_768, partial [Pseudomonadota bacterium]
MNTPTPAQAHTPDLSLPAFARAWGLTAVVFM